MADETLLQTEIAMSVCNYEIYGYLTKMSSGQTVEDDEQELLDIRLKVLGNFCFKIQSHKGLQQLVKFVFVSIQSNHFPPMEVHPLLADSVDYPARDKLGSDDICVINLERRPERRHHFEWIFRLLGVDYKLFKAVDGRCE